MGTILRIVSFPYVKVATNAGRVISRIKEESAFKKLICTIALLPLGGSIAMFLVAIISFIIQNGFGHQIELLKAGWWDAISSSSSDSVWTAGTSGYFFNIWTSIAVGAVFLFLSVISAINLYKNESKGKKIAFTISGILLVPAIAVGVIGILADAVLVPLIALGVALITAIVCIVLLSESDVFKCCITNIVCFFAIAPLTLLLVENIIGVVAFALTLLVIGIVAIFFGSALGSSGSGSSSSSAPAASTVDPKAAKERKKKEERITVLKNQINQYERSIEGYNKKELGYFGVDPKYCSKQAIKKRKELEDLRDSL